MHLSAVCRGSLLAHNLWRNVFVTGTKHAFILQTFEYQGLLTMVTRSYYV